MMNDMMWWLGRGQWLGILGQWSFNLATSCIKTISVSALIIIAPNKNASYLIFIKFSYFDISILSTSPLGSRIHGIYLPIRWVSGSTAPIRWPIG